MIKFYLAGNILSSYIIDLLPNYFYTSAMTNTDKPEKKQTGVRLSADLFKRLKYLSVDLERPLTDLFEEAVKDLLAKHQR